MTIAPPRTTASFVPTREAGLVRLRDFAPKAGGAYASNRNYDLGATNVTHVSGLSPYIRHRMLGEEEILQAILTRHSRSSAEKAVQEIFWRAYWKGWLQMRPGVWQDYQQGVQRGLNRVQTESGLRNAWETACAGETSIAPFDHWAQELVRTGYLHNHARMWFASIWIFTLNLPWELGADFFLRHLLDGDPASNTLGWRWVAGIQTPGKTYLARPDNIETYTKGRFRGLTGLAVQAPAIAAPPAPQAQPLPLHETQEPKAGCGVLITEEDLSPGWLLPQGIKPASLAALTSTSARSPLIVAPQVYEFTAKSMEDCLARHSARLGHAAVSTTQIGDIVAWAKDKGLTQVVTSFAPVGPVADRLRDLETALGKNGTALIRRIRPYDRAAWPHATHGFFRFRAKIPLLLDRISGLAQT